MATIDSNILLQARPPDVMQAAANGLNIGAAMQQMPIKNRLLESQVQAQELQNKASRQTLDAETAKFQLQDAASDAMAIRPLVESGDTLRANVLLAERIKKIQDRGGNPSDTIALRDQLNAGNVKGVLGELKTVEDLATKVGIFKDTSLEQQRLDQQQKYYDYLIGKGQRAEDAANGPGPQGKSVDAWAYNTLLNGDPNSKEFAAAKAHLSRSRTQLVQTENGLMPVAQPPVDLGWAIDGVNGPENPPIVAPDQPPAQQGGQAPTTGNVIPGTEKPATEDQSKAGGWLRQATNAYKNMTDAITKDPEAASPTMTEKLAGKVGTEAVNAVASPQRQRYINAASEFSEAVLRAATGAGVTIDEAKQKIEALTPGYFDSPELVAQKQKAMEVYLDSLRVRAGSTAKDVENPVENNDPLGLFQ